MASSIHYDIRCVLLLHLATSSLSSSSSPSTSFRFRAFSNDEAKEAVKLQEKPSICTADKLHYVSVPNSY
ncbi:hypothetical protein RchiOBHm_Chr5g0055191 [Rosa chinensis]|uniref:Uncharacterized protein n=1 Tax=Rosa chinensis TaxID=74649 RepID=A0A2P6QGC6_ROSCH|nr:hypothetical protein RchiOBHm_Chr5g0055191 [Rosa chinensis]